MVKYTQTIRRLLPTSFLRVFDHFVVLARKRIILDVNLNKNKYRFAIHR